MGDKGAAGRREGAASREGTSQDRAEEAEQALMEGGVPLEGDEEGAQSRGTPRAAGQSCCSKFVNKMFFMEKGATPPNWKYIFLMFISLFTSSFTLTYLFPFLPDMVLSFGYTEEEKGYYVGLVASCVFAGRACGSFFWGWLSDIRGRKLVLLLTIFGNGVTTLLFGFTYNLPMAMILRVLSGMANGTVGTAKTVLYEISDDSNQALGMASISLAWGCGLILGPTVGGSLASPAKHFPSVFSPDGFFGQFPFFLPSLVGFLIAMIGFLVVFFYFEETLQGRELELEVSTATLQPGVKTPSRLAPPSPYPSRALHHAMSYEDLLCDSETIYFMAQSQSLSTSLAEQSRRQPGDGHLDGGLQPGLGRNPAAARRFSSTPNLAEAGSAKRSVVFPTKKQQFHQNESRAGPGEITIVISPDNTSEVNQAGGSAAKDDQTNGAVANESRGGETSRLLRQNGHADGRDGQDVSGESPEEEKTRSSSCRWPCSGIKDSKLFKLMREPDVLKSVTLYTVFSFGVVGFDDVFTIWASTDVHLGGLNFSPKEIGVAIGALSIPMLFLQLNFFPMMTKKFGIIKAFLICDCVLVLVIQVTPLLHLIQEKREVLWVLLALLIIPNKMASSSCFAATSLMVNNSVKAEDAGSVNGIAMTATAVARTLAPTVGGSVFAWTMSYGSDNLGPPFDVSCAFFLLGMVNYGTVLGGIFMPRRLNSQVKKDRGRRRSTKAA